MFIWDIRLLNPKNRLATFNPKTRIINMFLFNIVIGDNGADKGMNMFPDGVTVQSKISHFICHSHLPNFSKNIVIRNWAKNAAIIMMSR